MINWETLKISEIKKSKKREILDSFLSFVICFIIIAALSWFVSINAFSEKNIHNFLKILVPLLIILVVVTCLVTYNHLEEKSYNISVELNLPNEYDLKRFFSNPGELLNKINTRVQGDTFVMYLSSLTDCNFYSKFKYARIVCKNGKTYFKAKTLQEDFYSYYLDSENYVGKGYKNSEDLKKDLEENLNLAFEKLLEFKSMDELVLKSSVK